MFHYNGKPKGSRKSASESSSSFHTAPSPHTDSDPTGRNGDDDDDDDIQTAIESSDASEIPSMVLGQSLGPSGRSAWSQSTYESGSFENDDDEASFYSTAFSSQDSRSGTFYTAMSGTTASDRSQTFHSRTSTLYSDEFESAGAYSTASSWDVDTSHDFKDPKDIERNFIKSKLRMLRSSKKSAIKSHQKELKDDTVYNEEQRKFIISHLYALEERKMKEGDHGKTSERPRKPTPSRKNHRTVARRKEETVADVLIPRGLVDRLRIENLLHNMRKVSSEPIHEPAKCDNCRGMQQKVAEAEFTREKRRLVYNKYTEERYMTHIVTHDPLNEIGTLAATLPKHSEDPQEIWDKLLQKGIT